MSKTISSDSLTDKQQGNIKMGMKVFITRYLAFPLTFILTIIPYYYFVYLFPRENLTGFFSTEMLAFVASAVVLALSLVFWEAVSPLEKFEENGFQRRVDITYSVVTGFLFTLLHPYIGEAIILTKYMGLNLTISEWPFWVQFLLGWAFHDLLLYWWHRALHESGNEFLWKLHEPHHSPERLNFMAGGRAHLLDVSALLITLLITRMIFGIAPDVMLWLLLYPVMTGAVHHTNVDFRLGFFNWLFPGPEMHRAHHDKDLNEALNYSTSFPIWDFIFGTAKPLRKGFETEYGLTYHNDKKENYWSAFLAPFKKK